MLRRLVPPLVLCVALVPISESAAQTVAQQAYLKASNTDAQDHFGRSVAISGDTAVVGAEFEASNANVVDGDQRDDSLDFAGAAYVYVRDGAAWSQQAYLKPSNCASSQLFGLDVAISGDTIVVGAPSEDSQATGVGGDENDVSAPGAGAAYVFVRNGTSWTQQAYLKASNTAADDHFGVSVAIEGDTLVVGAYTEDSIATGVDGDQGNDWAVDSGAVYVFVRSGTTWSQQAYVKASNTGAGDVFGQDVALSGDTLVVGAETEDSAAVGVDGSQANGATSSGAAYVFVRSGATWAQQAYLKASNTDVGDRFGHTVAASGDTVVVGAHHEDCPSTGVNGFQLSNSAQDAGAAYVFVRSGTTWAQQAYVKASNADAFDDFASAVAVSGDRLLIGSPSESSNATGVNGDQGNESGSNAGAAYAFRRNGTTWSQQAYLKASTWNPNIDFGELVALAGDSAVIGSWTESSGATGVNGDETDTSAMLAGAAWVIDLETAWTNLGAGLAGSNGVPSLDGIGPLAPSSSNQLKLTNAKPSSGSILVIGLSQLNAPFKGGTLVPFPTMLVFLMSNPSGALTLPFTWPANLPAGMSLYFQFWIKDLGAIAGRSASNGLTGVSG